MSDNFMKGFWEGFTFTAALAFVFFPCLIGLVDGIWVFLTGNALTSVPWNEWRIVGAFMWTFLWGWFLLSLS